MIDRIRQDIQERLEQLLAEADKLRRALTELGSSDGNQRRAGQRRSDARGSSSGSSSAGSSRARSRSASSSASATQSPRRTRSGAADGSADGTLSTARSSRATASGSASAGTRNASGGTKSAVLAALAGADGKPMTAGEVASSTGLGRASVSTTLSKLARSGEVTKAQRGYQLAAGGGASGASATSDSTTAEA